MFRKSTTSSNTYKPSATSPLIPYQRLLQDHFRRREYYCTSHIDSDPSGPPYILHAFIHSHHSTDPAIPTNYIPLITTLTPNPHVCLQSPPTTNSCSTPRTQETRFAASPRRSPDQFGQLAWFHGLGHFLFFTLINRLSVLGNNGSSSMLPVPSNG